MRKSSLAGKIGYISIYAVVILLGLICLLPLWYIVAVSFSRASAVEGNMVTLLPVGFNTIAYEEILETPNTGVLSGSLW